MSDQDRRCPPEHTHALKTTCYGAHKCRCFPCRRANADRVAEARLNPEPLTMAPEPVAAHVAYLKQFGYSYRHIGKAAGVNEGTPVRVARGRLRFVQAHIGRAILAVRPNIADLDLHTIVPARGVRRRIEALATQGWCINAVADHIGIARTHLSHLASREGGLVVRNHLLVAEAYEKLWNAPPPARDRWEQRTIVCTVNRARRNGWAPPLAWDDIDYDAAPTQPDAVDAIDVIAVDLAVSGDSTVHLTIQERREAVRQLSGHRRLPDTVIGRMLGVDEKTIANDRDTLGLPAAVDAGRHPVPRRAAA